jgi:cation diffusion facilitator family transporter
MDRARTIRRTGAVVLAANVALALLKAAVWSATGSFAVGSEAVNSAVDALYGGLVLGGLYLTTRPPDREHPHGHERIEPFVSLAVAVGVFAAAAGVGWSGIEAIAGTGGSGAGPSPAVGSPPAIGVLLLGAVAKAGLYRYCLGVGERVGSPAVIATAKDNRTDALAALAALAGVVGARLGVPVLDPIAAVVVAAGIAYTGVEVLRDNLPYLVGAAPPAALRDRIRRRALAHPAAEGVHDVVAHYVGPEVDVRLHVEVAGDRTLTEAHAIETAIAGSIAALDDVDDVFVHVDPEGLGEWKTDEG